MQKKESSEICRLKDELPADGISEQVKCKHDLVIRFVG